MPPRSPNRRRNPTTPRRAPRRRAGSARAAAGRVDRRAWLALGLVAALLIFPPTRAVAGRAWGRVDAALGAMRAEEARERMVAGYARQYGIPMELADAIERAARAERLDTELAFRLVRVESEFRQHARSHVGALGFTQLMPATAAELQPGITREQIVDRDTNLRLGFRYLKQLLAVYDGDEQEALTAYNRGPGTVARIRRKGGDPGNGYAELVLGRRGKSPVNLVPADSNPAPAAAPLHESAPARLPQGL